LVKTRFDVVVIGEIIIDILHYLPRLPCKKDTWHESVRAEKVLICPGGAGLYCAQALSKLGATSGIIGSVGNDALGGFLIESLDQAGVDTRGIKRPDMETPTCSILIIKHKEKISLGGAGSCQELRFGDIDPSYTSSARFLHFSGYYLFPKMWGGPSIRIMKHSQEHGLTTSLDTQMDRSGRYAGELEKVLKYVDILFLDEYEARAITRENSLGEASTELHTFGPDTVAIKLGAKGCFVSTKNEKVTIPAFKVKPVDTIGAGDAWDAGFIFGRLNHWEIKRSAKFANAVAALSLMGPGGAANVPSSNVVEAFIKGGFKG
jgi:sugar/nucleoside kinase (ribokinase family)